MAVDKIHLGEGGEPTADLLEILLRGTVAAHFARETTLPPHPLAINIEITFVLRTVALNASGRTKDDC